MSPTIDEVKRFQERARCPDYHVVWFGPNEFVIAHTDTERATIDLYDCELHRWLKGLLTAPVDRSGYYMWLPTWERFVLLESTSVNDQPRRVLI